MTELKWTRVQKARFSRRTYLLALLCFVCWNIEEARNEGRHKFRSSRRWAELSPSFLLPFFLFCHITKRKEVRQRFFFLRRRRLGFFVLSVVIVLFSAQLTLNGRLQDGKGFFFNVFVWRLNRTGQPSRHSEMLAWCVSENHGYSTFESHISMFYRISVFLQWVVSEWQLPSSRQLFKPCLQKIKPRILVKTQAFSDPQPSGIFLIKIPKEMSKISVIGRNMQR